MTIDNLIGVMQEATPKEMLDGLQWYQEAHEFALSLSREYAVKLEAVAGVIAALSPRNKWERNKQDAENVIRAFTDGRDPMRVSCCTFNRNKERAIEILKAGTRHGILSGQKVVAFANLIEFPESENVVIDTHAYNIYLGERLVKGSKGNGAPSLTKKRFEEAADAYRAAAVEYEIMPHQVQAITWVTWKRMHNA